MQPVWVRATGHPNTWVTKPLFSLKNKISVCCALRTSKLLPTSCTPHRPIYSPVGFFGNRLFFAGYLLVTELWMSMFWPCSANVPLWQSCRNAAVAAGVDLHAQPVPASLHADPSLVASAMALDTAGQREPACRFGQLWPKHPCHHLSLDAVADPLQDEAELRQWQLDGAAARHLWPSATIVHSHTTHNYILGVFLCL